MPGSFQFTSGGNFNIKKAGNVYVEAANGLKMLAAVFDPTVASTIARLADGGVDPDPSGEIDTNRFGYFAEEQFLFTPGGRQLTGSNAGVYFDVSGATASFKLGGGVFGDVLVGGFANDILLGNGGNDSLRGGRGNDVLNGGAGNDQMRGGFGNDTYLVDSGSDLVFEAANQGTDRVIVVGSSSFALASGQDVERVETQTVASTASVNLTGNQFAQLLIGNNGNNVLSGKGGPDTLRGNGGQDAFLFDTALGKNNPDTILDFVAADDTIRLENRVFDGIGANGALDAALFQANASGKATQADDRIIYETDTGKLFYDANGSASGGAIQFALLKGHPAITAADFLVV